MQNKIFISFPTKMKNTSTENKIFIPNFFPTLVDMQIIQFSTSFCVKNHPDVILRKKIMQPFSPFLKFFIHCFWHHEMLKNTFLDLELSKQITQVESRAFSKFEAVELKYQGVLVDSVSQIQGRWTQNHPDRLRDPPSIRIL